ncbi:MAG TPA: hypothetical protein V6C76_16675 [Drouetiella sp.]
MAVLQSEDQDYKTSLRIVPGSAKLIQNQMWQRYSIHLHSGQHEIKLGGKDASQLESDSLLVCRKPKDEIQDLIDRLKLIVDFERDKLLFEPAEPCFELSIARSGVTGIKVELWLDPGNAKTGIYRWDGVGIRFYTLQEHLVSFLKELEDEFAC